MPGSGRPPEDAPRSGEGKPFPSKSDVPSATPTPSPSSEDETLEERLARVEKNLAAGLYDSDEMLQRAMEIMLRNITDDPE